MAAIIPVLCVNAQSIPADYKAYLAAAQAVSEGKPTEALSSLEAVWAFSPESPLTGYGSVIAARCYLELGQPASAVSLLQKYIAMLPQPSGYLMLGKASEAAGAIGTAAAAYQRVYYEYPGANEAEEAATALSRLTAQNGSEVPPVLPESVFTRADILRRLGRAAAAKQELLSAANQFGGVDHDLANVRAYTGDYRGLSLLRVKSPEADAERLYLMHAVSRRNSQTAQAEAAIRELNERYPKSKWTMEALISWGNHHLLRNNVAEYEGYYSSCAERFASDPRAAYCHWKIAWAAWMSRDPKAPKLLEAHVTRFPDSEKVAAALYFLGRYKELAEQYPLSFYSTLAASKKARLAVKASATAGERFAPSPVMKLRTERARQLESAGYMDWAEFELKFAAREQPFVAATELADLISRRGAHDKALRYIKSLAKGYLLMPLDAAPQRFWKLAFPLPYTQALVSNSRARDLDPNMVAALIRQESEFNPRAISRAKAYGLTQVLPSTGRQLSRRIGPRGFRASMLFEPETNLKLGTYHLKSLLDANGGRWEMTLAAYNAGQSRVNEWRTWYEYREPAEFIESIPFSETRNYVQVVLRNADVYRRLYGTGWSEVRSAGN